MTPKPRCDEMKRISALLRRPPQMSEEGRRKLKELLQRQHDALRLRSPTESKP